jgi:hypothetical protein
MVAFGEPGQWILLGGAAAERAWAHAPEGAPIRLMASAHPFFRRDQMQRLFAQQSTPAIGDRVA